MRTRPHGPDIPHEPGDARSIRALAQAVFDQILAGERAVQAVDHPLDFVCIPIVRTPRFGVCGHIWSHEHAASTIHSHSWHLHSEVILGAIANEVFPAIARPGGGHEVVRVDSVGLTDRLIPTGLSVELRDPAIDVYRAGDSYTLEAGTFHRSLPVSPALTLTLIRATILTGHHDQIVAGPPSRTRTTRRALLPQAKALSLVSLFRDTIEASRADVVRGVRSGEAAGRPPRRPRVPSPSRSAD